MPTSLALTSPAFQSSGPISDEYTCEGADVSPRLEWSGVPDETESFVLLVDDPDAPGQTFTHWVLFDLPGDTTGLPRAVDIDAHFAQAAPRPREGRNGFGDVGYGGPCPPPDDGPHRYFFRLYALDDVLDLGRGVSTSQVRSAMADLVLANTDLVGTYER